MYFDGSTTHAVYQFITTDTTNKLSLQFRTTVTNIYVMELILGLNAALTVSKTVSLFK